MCGVAEIFIKKQGYKIVIIRILQIVYKYDSEVIIISFYSQKSFLLRLQRAYLATHTECKSMPKIKGEVFLNAKGVKLEKNVTFYQGAYL